ncbi:acyl-CoA dehydrogenase family protein [Chitinasiproducens palmae]|uniref:Acyl-CoA dehydrogenase n=1 Tax=Chitinasiproducens palmae TaxID=1770053 RepID=A0A1H2PJH3_9BURK|nr:acyl-CoA dehydrogenase family protein [Chitinasiproducens palmae]SDV46494.1 Acyl-CoA dehydrogenase [Chitinasiproducens palmae]
MSLSTPIDEDVPVATGAATHEATAASRRHPDRIPSDGGALLRAGREIASQIGADAAAADRDRVLPHAAFDMIRREGLGAARIDAARGGPGASVEDLTRLSIVLAEADSNVAQALLPHWVSLERLLLMSSPAQRRKVENDVLAGVLYGNGTTERGTLRPLDVETRLQRTGDGYRLRGRKFYSTGSLMADQTVILARDDADELVYVLLPIQRAGVQLLDDWHGMGQRLTASGTTVLDDVQVYPDDIVGLKTWFDNRHYTGAFSQLIHCSIEVGIARAALADGIAWAHDGARPVKESGVDSVLKDPYVVQLVGDLATDVYAAETATLAAARDVDAAARLQRDGGAHPAALEARLIAASIAVSHAKIISTKAALRVATHFYEVGGASGALAKHAFDRHWRNARTHTLHDPVAYKYKAVGDFHLNGIAPPVGFVY